MIYRLFGALLLILGFGGVGFLINRKRRQELRMLQQMNRFLDNVICDLRYRQAPLQQLINSSLDILSGELQVLLKRFSNELEAQISPDVSCCMSAVISSGENLPASVRNILTALGQSLGRYDIQGQVRCLEGIQIACKTNSTNLADELDRSSHCRQAYALGAGAILALIML